MARYEAWAPFTANAGTYEVTGGTLTTRPIMAKNPSVMGQPSTREFKIAGKTLDFDPRSPQRSTDNHKTTLTRVE